MLNVVMLSVDTLNVIMLNVVMQTVVASVVQTRHSRHSSHGYMCLLHTLSKCTGESASALTSRT
jgi:hypothetical protein